MIPILKVNCKYKYPVTAFDTLQIFYELKIEK